MNIVAFTMITNEAQLLYFIDDSMNSGITKLNLTLYGSYSYSGRYTHAYHDVTERNKAWEKLFTEKFMESVKNGYFMNMYSNFDDMFDDDVFVDRSGLRFLLYFMKDFFGKVPVPYRGNKYYIELTDTNFEDEIERERYEMALDTIHSNIKLLKRCKEHAKELKSCGYNDSDEDIPF